MKKKDMQELCTDGNRNVSRFWLNDWISGKKHALTYVAHKYEGVPPHVRAQKL